MTHLIKQVALFDFRPHHERISLGAEVLGRAIGHELRACLDAHEPFAWPGFADFIDPSLSATLVGHHIADVL
jgi:hypothetical protein